MLKFLVLQHGQPTAKLELRNAHLIGSDGHAMRGEITFEKSHLFCHKREAGSVSLAMQVDTGDCGVLTLQTTLLPESERPYLLSVELARHRLMLLIAKLEEWQMFELEPEHTVSRRLEVAKGLFIEALSIMGQDAVKANQLAEEALVRAIDGSEELALAHAELLLGRRRHLGSLPKQALGAGVALSAEGDLVRGAVMQGVEYLHLPTPWRELAPSEGESRFEGMDRWVDWATAHHLPLCAGPIINFDAASLPDWLFIWEHDYETMRDMLYEHIERTVTRYKGKVAGWTAVSGLHVNSHFALSFDQLIELTRMSVMVVKKIDPRARVFVEIREPFGEYYGRNHRSIPPQMYADLMIQGAVPFDAFGIKLLMGQAMSGQYTRDLMQVSALLDEFAGLGKPLRVTVAAPSESVSELMIASPDPAVPVDAQSGYWRKPWSPTVQAHWLEAVLQVALSKPFVEAACWHELVDHPDADLPLSGLITEDLEPKPGLRRLIALRKRLRESAAAQGSVNA